MKHLLLIAAAALPLAAQDYVMLSYFKITPGKEAEARKLHDTYSKGVPAMIQTGFRKGYMRLIRVHPSSHETGYDFIGVHYLPGAPKFGEPFPDAAFKARGDTREQAVASQRGVYALVKQEIWREAVSIGDRAKTGDFLRVSFIKAQTGYAEFHREYFEGIIKEAAAQGAPFRGYRRLTPALGGNRQEYNAIGSYVFPDSQSVFKAFPAIHGIFQKLYPGKSYDTFVARRREASATVKTEIFRVDFVERAK